jgi:hypothetical protein
MYPKKSSNHSMKTAYSLVGLLFFMSCEKEGLDINKKNIGVTNDLVTTVEKSETLELNKFINYSDALEHAIKDKDGLLKLNNIRLLSYEETSNDKNEILDFNNKQTIILKRKDFAGDRNINYSREQLNEYSIDVVRNSNKTNKDFLLKKKEFISRISTNEPTLKVINLNWFINGKRLSTVAYFKKGELLYDDILSNYTILDVNYSSDNSNTTNKRINTTNFDYSPAGCAAQYYFSYSPIYYTDEIIETIMTDPIFGIIASASCSITISGEQSPNDCAKYIHSASVNGRHAGSFLGAADAKAHVELQPAGIDGPGYCNYVLAIALQSTPWWSNITISLQYEGVGFSISPSPFGGSVTFQEKYGHVTADDLY